MTISKTKLNVYSNLRSRKQRLKAGLFTAEGEKCVADTLAMFDVEAIVAFPGWIENHKDIGLTQIYEVDEVTMRKMSQLQTLPEVIAVYHMPDIAEPNKKTLESSLTLLLDAVQDPGNLGTIIRTASWFGVEQVVLGAGCVDPFNPKTVQASMGAIGMVNIAQAHLLDLIDKNQDIPVYGTLLDGEDIYSAMLRTPAFVVMGNEGNGLSDDLRRRVTHPLLIPSFANGPHAESLNVAAATAVTLSEFRRQNSIAL